METAEAAGNSCEYYETQRHAYAMAIPMLLWQLRGDLRYRLAASLIVERGDRRDLSRLIAGVLTPCTA